MSSNRLDTLDKAIINAISADFPISERPYNDVAERLGVSEAEVLDRVLRLKEAKCLRRVSVALFHTKVGFSCNVLAVWDVADDIADETGAILARHNGVSHCYRRARTDDWPYNLYTMVHARSKEEAAAILDELKSGITYRKHAVLYTKKELKKTGMKYFT